ncbi:WecB/TagA/CpsF family glycosyltransferase [Flavobacterium sp.]|uniref:WecB/TagA/CpsF family glycosyltransferase n=1 Tax=Flavobacterium sp. TaxID=239 RepID=UPI003BC0B6E4
MTNNSILPISLMNYTIYSADLSDLKFDKKTLINTINQYSFCIAQQDAAFKKALQGSDVLLPDGMAIVAAAKLLTKNKIKKIAGADLHDFLLNKLNETGGSCFYLGASESTLAKITTKIHKEFPKVKVQSYSPPFKAFFTESDNQSMIAAVNAVTPEVLFIGMTAPKQEKWAFQHKDLLQTQTICSIGAVFDFYAGTVKRPSPLWVSLGLEWFIRLLKEPKRMWKRYLYYGPFFIRYIIWEKFRLMFNQDK